MGVTKKALALLLIVISLCACSSDHPPPDDAETDIDFYHRLNAALYEAMLADFKELGTDAEYGGAYLTYDGDYPILNICTVEGQSEDATTSIFTQYFSEEAIEAAISSFPAELTGTQAFEDFKQTYFVNQVSIQYSYTYLRDIQRALYPPFGTDFISSICVRCSSNRVYVSVLDLEKTDDILNHLASVIPGFEEGAVEVEFGELLREESLQAPAQVRE